MVERGIRFGPPAARLQGEAALFHAKFPYVYNTVFDRSRFEHWFAERTESGGFRLRPTEQIRATLRQQGITHVLVNWSEILRYREPGSYGYTDFAHPDWLAKLQSAGVLEPPLPLPDRASNLLVEDPADQLDKFDVLERLLQDGHRSLRLQILGKVLHGPAG